MRETCKDVFYSSSTCCRIATFITLLSGSVFHFHECTNIYWRFNLGLIDLNFIVFLQIRPVSVSSRAIKTWRTFSIPKPVRICATGIVTTSTIFFTGHVAFHAKADATPPGKNESELSLRDALIELNEAIDELMKKMQVALPELNKISPLWLLGFVPWTYIFHFLWIFSFVIIYTHQFFQCHYRLSALAAEHLQDKITWKQLPTDYSVSAAHTMRRYGAIAHAIYEDSPEAFWGFLRESASPYFSRENYQLLTYSSVSDRESPAYALLVDHHNREILVCIRYTHPVYK